MRIGRLVKEEGRGKVGIARLVAEEGRGRVGRGRLVAQAGQGRVGSAPPPSEALKEITTTLPAGLGSSLLLIWTT